jgi:hypothetical protein
MRARFAFLILLLPLIANAQPFERFLLPIYLPHPVHGIAGSVWNTTLSIQNPSSSEFHIEWCSPDPGEGCQAILRASARLASGETQDGLPPPEVGVHGRVLYITPLSQPAGDPRVLEFHLRVFDSSRSDLNSGTEIPVVRQRDFRRTTAHLLNVPIHAKFRLLLRVYEMDLPQAEFAIRVYDHDFGTFVSERRMTIRVPRPESTFRFMPAYGDIGDLADVPRPLGFPVRLRIEVEPLTPGSAFWTFVSVTNNDTQQITLVTPQ